VIDLGFDEGVYILRMQSGENRFNLDFLEALNGALDEVEKSSGPAALVTTGEGKFYSNGLDLEWITAQSPNELPAFGKLLQRTFARLVAFPLVTVAAMNGHVFAAGAALAMSHDFRVMRSDRGYFCFPEVDIGVPFSAGVMGILKSRLPSATLHEALITGRRYDAEAALSGGIVDAVHSESDVLPEAIEMASALKGKDRATLVALRRGLYGKVIAQLTRDSESAASRK